MRGGLPARPLPADTAMGARERVAHLLGGVVGEAGVDRAFAAGWVVGDDDVAIEPSRIMGPDEPLYIHRPVPDETHVPIEIIAEGEGWIAVNKPAGLATMPRGAYVARSVVVQARRQFDNDDIVPAHRLDRLTSGVLLLVTERASRSRIQGWFQDGLVHRRYRAVSHPGGREELLDGAWHEVALRLEKSGLQVEVVAGEPNARTRLRALSVGEEIEWDLAPLTGRTHQLRVTLAYLGFPIIGDPLYPGVRESEELRLHAYHLAGPGFEVQAPLPTSADR
ncbi:hypothetical protein BSZ39_02040 [Bowdeniella nasicola]|uniref:RNA pseudouridylate synthase n=2 Tax=Bowdeniella nasicola TaxID=208480 RepID=A0A1Q5Q4R6_9ACTO|nr:hypothetical protein BSZ39_02040 [Bowdeniella nasicola]